MVDINAFSQEKEKCRKLRKYRYRVPRRVYGSFIYNYCKKHNFKRFRITVYALEEGRLYPELKGVMSIAEARQGLLYLRDQGKAVKDGMSWIIL